MQGSPDAKKPCKGILKTSSSFDRPSTSYHRKSAKFDELNVSLTLHPADKDYGHMKIDEPKTPYNYDVPSSDQDQLDADLLREKLRIAADTQPPYEDNASDEEDDDDDDDMPETEEEKVRRVEFERRRKEHYREFDAVKLARKLIEEELADEEEDEDKKVPGSPADQEATDDNLNKQSHKILESDSTEDKETIDSLKSNNTQRSMDVEPI